MTAEHPEGGTFQVTRDTLGERGGEKPGWGVDCPGCGDWTDLRRLVDGHVCDCGVRLALDVVFTPGAADSGVSESKPADDR